MVAPHRISASASDEVAAAALVSSSSGLTPLLSLPRCRVRLSNTAIILNLTANMVRVADSRHRVPTVRVHQEVGVISNYAFEGPEASSEPRPAAVTHLRRPFS